MFASASLARLPDPHASGWLLVVFREHGYLALDLLFDRRYRHSTDEECLRGIFWLPIIDNRTWMVTLKAPWRFDWSSLWRDKKHIAHSRSPIDCCVFVEWRGVIIDLCCHKSAHILWMHAALLAACRTSCYKEPCQQVLLGYSIQEEWNMHLSTFPFWTAGLSILLSENRRLCTEWPLYRVVVPRDISKRYRTPLQATNSTISKPKRFHSIHSRAMLSSLLCRKLCDKETNTKWSHVRAGTVADN